MDLLRKMMMGEAGQPQERPSPTPVASATQDGPADSPEGPSTEDKLRESNRALTGELEACRERIANLEAELAQAQLREPPSETQKRERATTVQALKNKLKAEAARGEELSVRASNLEEAKRILEQIVADLKGELKKASVEIVALKERNKKLEGIADSWFKDSEPADVEKMLSKVAADTNASGPLRRLAKLLLDEVAVMARILQSKGQNGEISVRGADVLNVFEPVRPLTVMDVKTDEVATSLGMLAQAECVRRKAIVFLQKGGLEPIRPIPGVSKFDASYHQEVPALRKSTTRVELDGIITQRVDVGIIRTEGVKRTVVRPAQVGKYVYERPT